MVSYNCREHSSGRFQEGELDSAVVESLLLAALLATEFLRQKTRWRKKSDQTATAMLVVFAFVATNAASRMQSIYILMLALIFLRSALDPLRRGSQGLLAQSRFVHWMSRGILGREESQNGLEPDIVDVLFKLLSLGVWLLGFIVVSKGMVFRTMVGISLCVTASSGATLLLKRRISPFDDQFRDKYLRSRMLSDVIVISLLSLVAFASGQMNWMPVIGFLAAWVFHWYLFERFGASTRSVSTGPGEVMVEWEGFLLTASAHSVAHHISLLIMAAFAMGVIRTSEPLLSSFLLTVAGVSGGIIAVVTMLGILLLQTDGKIGMPPHILARGLKGFALAFVALIGVALAGVLLVPGELDDLRLLAAGNGLQGALAATLVFYVLGSLPYALLYLLSLVWDVLPEHSKKTGL